MKKSKTLVSKKLKGESFTLKRETRQSICCYTKQPGNQVGNGKGMFIPTGSQSTVTANMIIYNDGTIAEWQKGDAAILSVNSSGTLKVSSGGNAWGITNSLGKVILAPSLLSRRNYKLASIFIHEMRHSIDFGNKETLS